MSKFFQCGFSSIPIPTSFRSAYITTAGPGRDKLLIPGFFGSFFFFPFRLRSSFSILLYYTILLPIIFSFCCIQFLFTSIEVSDSYVVSLFASLLCTLISLYVYIHARHLYLTSRRSMLAKVVSESNTPNRL